MTAEYQREKKPSCMICAVMSLSSTKTECKKKLGEIYPNVPYTFTPIVVIVSILYRTIRDHGLHVDGDLDGDAC